MQVEIAVGGAQAIATLEEGGAFDLILSDLRMPDVDGPAFYRWIEENRPEYAKRFGVVTGDILGPSATRFLSDVDLPVLEKPFSRGRLRALIESFF